jgi:hypothetical protein
MKSRNYAEPGTYEETEMSSKAREIFLREAHPGSIERQGYEFLKFNPERKKELSLPSGELKIEAVYDTLGKEEPRFALVKRCIELNLTKEEVRRIIKHRFEKGELYGKKDAPLAMKCYVDWCKEFSLEPDSILELPEESFLDKARKGTL